MELEPHVVMVGMNTAETPTRGRLSAGSHHCASHEAAPNDAHLATEPVAHATQPGRAPDQRSAA